MNRLSKWFINWAKTAPSGSGSLPSLRYTIGQMIITNEIKRKNEAEMYQALNEQFDNHVKILKEAGRKVHESFDEMDDKHFKSMKATAKAELLPEAITQETINQTVNKKIADEGGNPNFSPQKLKQMFQRPEVQERMRTDSKIQEHYTKYQDLEKSIGNIHDEIKRMRYEGAMEIDEHADEVKSSVDQMPSERYSVEEMAVCLTEAAKLIPCLNSEERRKSYYELFDTETYKLIVDHMAENEVIKMNHYLQETYTHLLKELADQEKENDRVEKEKEEKLQPKEPEKIDPKELFAQMKFSATDMRLNLETMRKLPQVFRTVMASPNVPGDLRKKYDKLDEKIEKLSPTQLKSISKILVKYMDPKTGVVPPVQLVVTVGELLTHKPANRKTENVVSGERQPKE